MECWSGGPGVAVTAGAGLKAYESESGDRSPHSKGYRPNIPAFHSSSIPFFLFSILPTFRYPKTR
jgi:hypothetical protein